MSSVAVDAEASDGGTSMAVHPAASDWARSEAAGGGVTMVLLALSMRAELADMSQGGPSATVMPRSASKGGDYHEVLGEPPAFA